MRQQPEADTGQQLAEQGWLAQTLGELTDCPGDDQQYQEDVEDLDRRLRNRSRTLADSLAGTSLPDGSLPPVGLRGR